MIYDANDSFLICLQSENSEVAQVATKWCVCALHSSETRVRFVINAWRRPGMNIEQKVTDTRSEENVKNEWRPLPSVWCCTVIGCVCVCVGRVLLTWATEEREMGAKSMDR